MRIRVAGMVWIAKGDLGPDAISGLKGELRIIPRKTRDFDNVPPTPIDCWSDNGEEFGVPRDYFFSTATKEHRIQWDVTEGRETDYENLISHTGTYAEQGRAVDGLIDWFRGAQCFDGVMSDGKHLGAILKADPGFGKCLGLGTPVFMYDGTVKAVEDICEGDLIMGPDSRPRKVSNVTRGRGELYEIVPIKGEPWICNNEHVLTLVCSGKRRKDKVIDIPLNEYLLKDKTFQERCKLFQPKRIDFCVSDSLIVDPYFVGIWLGDGTKNLSQGIRVTSPDSEIVQSLHEVAETWGLEVTTTYQEDRADTYRIVNKDGKRNAGRDNSLLNAMRILFHDGMKIPHNYLVASYGDRMELLAGIIDIDGYLASGGGTYEVVQKNSAIADGLVHLARGLGFRITRFVKYVNECKYYRLFISGDTDRIPVRIFRKKAKPRKQIKSALRTGFSVKSIGIGEYAGFVLDGDGRFLLGDYTVTHNTNTALSTIHRLGRTAVVIVHKERLLVQWVKRIQKFLPGARVGIVQENKCQFEDRDIVVAMMQSLALEGKDGNHRYPKEFYDWPGVLVLDEIHRVGAPTWSSIPKLFSAKYRLGLSATPRRRDGADSVFWWHIGQIRYSAKTEMPVLPVRLIESGTRGPDLMRLKSTPSPIVINVLTRLTWRNKQIVAEIMKAIKSPKQRKLMILSERLEHLRELDNLLLEACKKDGLEGVTTGFYVGEWFTGEQQSRLVRGHWEMDEEGREKAVDTIFNSFKRRKALKAKKDDSDNHRFIYVGNEWIDLDSLYKLAEKEGTTPRRREEILSGVDGILFDIAREYGILQKKKEKKRSMTEAELHEAERARVIWVTFQMCSEGIDLPAVDTLGFVSPVSDIEQSYGRGRRFCVPVGYGGSSTPEMCRHYCAWRAEECTGKPAPMAFDILDKNVFLAKKRYKYRSEFYRSLGAKLAGDGS